MSSLPKGVLCIHAIPRGGKLPGVMASATWLGHTTCREREGPWEPEGATARPMLGSTSGSQAEPIAQLRSNPNAGFPRTSQALELSNWVCSCLRSPHTLSPLLTSLSQCFCLLWSQSLSMSSRAAQDGKLHLGSRCFFSQSNIR